MTSVHRDTRVIWVKNTPGTGQTLYYQSQDGDYDSSVVRPGDPGTEKILPGPLGPRKFGPRSPRESALLGRPVPEEFVEAALARSEQMWGATETIDPHADWLATRGYAHAPAMPSSQPPVQVTDPSTIKAMQLTYFGDDDETQPMDVFKQKPNRGPTSFVPQQDPR